MAATDKNWAQEYINDPLTAPQPADETGPGSSLRPETEPLVAARPVTPIKSEPRRLSKTHPLRQDRGTAKEAQTTTVEAGYPSPPPSASPHASGSHRRDFLGPTTRPRRSSSLKERFPGDPSVRPLDQLAREKAQADRARHVTKKHAIRPDTIDGLDNSGLGPYHHEGPYDATLFARNSSHKSSPVAAVAESNTEALRATPHEKIVDSVQGHRPLDGVAAYPAGTIDQNGQTYNYTEGDNMMIEENAGGGPYRRWPGIEYQPDDIKGKGEPSYSIEKALKEHSLAEKDGNTDFELKSNPNRGDSAAIRSEAFGNDDGLRRSGSLGNRLKKRVGSLKKKFKDDE